MTTDNPRQRRDRHVARSARILSTGLSATAILGITAAFGAAERAQSAAAPTTVPPTSMPEIQTTMPALAPLGATPLSPDTVASVATATAAPSINIASPVQAAATLGTVTQLPSPIGTVTLPNETIAQAQTPATPDTLNASTVADAAAAATATTPTPAPTAASTAAPSTAPAPDTTTVAPIAPAEPPVELTLPPAPSNGSSGGSR